MQSKISLSLLLARPTGGRPYFLRPSGGVGEAPHSALARIEPGLRLLRQRPVLRGARSFLTTTATHCVNALQVGFTNKGNPVADNFSNSFSYENDEWRRSVAYRRNLLCFTVCEILRDGEHTLEAWIDRLYARIGYKLLNEKDQVNARQSASYIRKIVSGWSKVDDETRDDFLSGRIAPSTLAKLVGAQGGRGR